MFVCVVLLALPALASGALSGAVPMSATDGPDTNATPSSDSNLTVVTAQGGELGSDDDSRVLVFDPSTGEAVWEANDYETYYDVDPLDNSTLLYAAISADGGTYAVEHDWQSGEEERLFRLPFDSHDVDYLGDGEYAYLDGGNDTAVVYNHTRQEVVWTYDFREHYPPSAGNGPESDYSGDYTHLNDVVPVDNGSKFLLSPRNFDRVMLVDRETKAVEWTLGEEDNYTILNQQHNPSLVSTDPPTVLVADSENDRVVEYRREDGDWTMVWEYEGSLAWPRDADRLPNGNTLIVDSYRAIEVTPDREIVWESSIPRYLYDIERIALGDEPGGPSMATRSDSFASADDDRDRVVGGPAAELEDAAAAVYNTVYWVLPWWLGPLGFVLLVPALILTLAWLNVEIERAIAGRVSTTVSRTARRVTSPWRRRWSAGVAPTSVPRRFHSGLALLTVGVFVVPLGILLRLVPGAGPISSDFWWNWVPPHFAVILLLSLEGMRRLLVASGPDGRWTETCSRLYSALAALTAVLGIVLAAFGVLSSADLLALSNAGTLLAFGSVAVFGLLSFVQYSTVPRGDRLSNALDPIAAWAPARYAAGLGVVATSLFVLGQGLQTAVFPLSSVVLSFVFLLDGDRILARTETVVRPSLGRVLAVLRYSFRPVWLAVAAALVAKTLGAGAMANIVADIHLFNTVTLGVVLVVVSRLGAGIPARLRAESASSTD